MGLYVFTLILYDVSCFVSSDGSTQALGTCLRDFRNKPYPVRAKITYYKRTLTVRKITITRLLLIYVKTKTMISNSLSVSADQLMASISIMPQKVWLSAQSGGFNSSLFCPAPQVMINNGFTPDKEDYEFCTKVDNMIIPTDGFFGISAATGGLAGNCFTGR